MNTFSPIGMTTPLTVCDNKGHINPEIEKFLNTEIGVYHCYECGDKGWHRPKDIQSYDCASCGGRKCTLHGGDSPDMKHCVDCWSQENDI